MTTAATTILAALALSLTACAFSQPVDDDYARQRKALAFKPRRLILNNDGCDALYFPETEEITKETFLAKRTSPLAGSHVDTVYYCSICSGFSNFTHKTEVGTILTRDMELLAGQINISQQLIDQDTDPLRAVVEWCHENGLEAFWSMRMNDTHDGAHRPEKPYPLFPPLKHEHPEWMIGTLENRPRYGSWTSVDYTLPEIRDLAFRYIEEVCRNHDVDGVELDYFRHLSYLKTVAYGGIATDEEVELMTGFMRRLREMADREGKKRGRPILIATRAPDSAEYGRAVGLDIETWMAEGLIDIVVGSGYFQLNPWEYLVELGHKHGIAVYAGLSESRVRGEGGRFRRQSAESYRGRALRAWQAGVDAVYLFNYFNPKGGFLREIGDPELLRGLDHIYFASIRNGNPNSYLADGKRFQNVSIVTPSDPLAVNPGTAESVDVAIGDDFSQFEAGQMPTVTCHVMALGGERLSLRVNDSPAAEGTVQDSWVDYPLDPAHLKLNVNQFHFDALARPGGDEPEWSVVWTAEDKPKAPWAGDRTKPDVLAKLEDGAMLIADRGEDSGDYMYYAYAWNADPNGETVVEAVVKVGDGWNNIIVENGVAHERIMLYPDYIGTYTSKLRYDMDLTDDFHTVRVVLKGQDILVYVDGELRLDATGKYTNPGNGRNALRFGAANSGSLGEAYWKEVKFRTPSVTIYDVVVSVRQPKEGE